MTSMLTTDKDAPEIRGASNTSARIEIASRPMLADPITVAVFLKGLADLIQGAIESARNAGLSMEIEAGRELNIAIENAKNALSEVLGEKLKDIDKTIQGSLYQLRGMVEDLVNHVAIDLDVLSQAIQTFVDGLPFHKKEPKLMQVLPRFVVPSRQNLPTMLEFHGNFELAADNKFKPTLTVNLRPYDADVNDTRLLKFNVSLSDLVASSPPGDPNRFSYGHAILSVPWERSTWLGIRKKRVVDQYKTVVGLLPESPGRIKLNYSTSHPDQRQQPFTSTEYYQSSASDGANDDHKDVSYAVSPTSGWHVQRNSTRFTVVEAHGDWSHSFVSDDGDKVVYKVTTIHHKFSEAGRVRFKIEFTEYRDISAKDPKELDVRLKWGDSESFDLEPGDWKVTFDAFDGSHQEFISADVSNPFLKVRATSTGIVLQAADPKTLIWP
jgi:hypothetical protein